jgi:hypothetical protein
MILGFGGIARSLLAGCEPAVGRGSNYINKNGMMRAGRSWDVFTNFDRIGESVSQRRRRGMFIVVVPKKTPSSGGAAWL